MPDFSEFRISGLMSSYGGSPRKVVEKEFAILFENSDSRWSAFGAVIFDFANGGTRMVRQDPQSSGNLLETREALLVDESFPPAGSNGEDYHNDDLRQRAVGLVFSLVQSTPQIEGGRLAIERQQG